MTQLFWSQSNKLYAIHTKTTKCVWILRIDGSIYYIHRRNFWSYNNLIERVV